MALEIIDKGRKNTVIIPKSSAEKLFGRIHLNGTGNIVHIGEECISAVMDIMLTGGSKIEIGDKTRLGALRVRSLAGGSVTIGARCNFNGASRLLLHEKASIVIEDECTLGGNCTLSISDMHSIVDLASGERINHAKDIHMARHVWLGESVTLLKGAAISQDSIIGIGSVVTGKIPANVVAAGTPARVVREGVTWDFRLL